MFVARSVALIEEKCHLWKAPIDFLVFIGNILESETCQIDDLSNYRHLQFLYSLRKVEWRSFLSCRDCFLLFDVVNVW